MQRLKKFICLIILCSLSISSLSGCSDREIVLTTAFESKELMRLNGKSCYLNEMMLYLTTVQNQYESVYGRELWNETDDGVSLEEKVKDNVLAKIAQVKVMNLMAESYNLTLDDEETEMVKAKAQSFYASLNETERTLLNVDEEDIYNFYYEYAMSEKVYDYVIRDVNPEISDDEARTVTVQQILIKTYATDSNGNIVEYTERSKEEAREKAEDIRELALAGEDSFESLAANYNEGDEMTYTFGRGEMAESFEEAAFSLDNGAISDVIETEYGYHILKCISNFDEESTEANKVTLLEKRKEEVFDETYDEFVSTVSKSLNEKLYDSIIMIHNDEVTTSSFFDVDF